MQRFTRAFTAIGFLMLAAQMAAAQAVPDHRYIGSRNTDYFGADLDPLFDTDRQSCIRACSADPLCQAFTFNSRSNACFPKRAVAERSAYQGALSGEKRATDPAVLSQAGPRAVALSFLGADLLDAARRDARDLGLTFTAGKLDLQTLTDTARARSAQGNQRQAIAWMGAAVSVADRADLWTEYARLMLAYQPAQTSQRRDFRLRALRAAANAYLRGGSAPERASALQVLAEALIATGRGRDAIPALRLAVDEQARTDLQEQLDDAIAKFGFRVTDTTVESDSARPRICMAFSEPLISAGMDYEPFLRSDVAGLVVQAQKQQLCVDGVEHGQRYSFTLRAGLPAASGEALWKNVEITQYVRDRSPEVRFPGRAYVLPMGAGAALPVETVNLTKLDLTLRRVSDRNLMRAVQDGFFGRPLSQWEAEIFDNEIAQLVWSGTAEVASELNRDLTTRLPMAKAIAGREAGIYALTAQIPGADPYDTAAATQWFVLSDLGISAMAGADGMTVALRSLSDSGPLAGVEVTLISRANAVLGRAVTDAEGFATFAAGLTRGTGSAAPALLLAGDADRDLGFLSLTDPAFDLSDRGAEGRPPAGPVDVFLTTDRGAYRAGETIYATALARDGDMRGIEGLPLTAILSRPDGVEYRRLTSDGGRAGGHVFNLTTGPTVPRGAWTLELRTDPNGNAVASQRVLIEDFLPERIDFDLTLPKATLRPGDAPPLTVEARYLFGAPGSDLAVEGEATLRAMDQVESWPGYRFGRYDRRVTPRSARFDGARTGASGAAVIPLTLPEAAAEDRPLQLTVTARVSDGSARPVERRVTAPVQPAGPVIGIKPLFDDVVGEGSKAAFELIALSPTLAPTQMPVKWTLNRVHTRYQWYQQYGRWNWEPVTRRTRIATGQVHLGTAPLAIDAAVDWGRYELVVERVGGAYVASAMDFYAGWHAPADASATPDRLDMSLDSATYRAGDTARLRIDARHAGTALVSVLTNRVVARQVVDLTEGENLIPIEVTEAWGTGAYVAATLIRPMDVQAGQNPARAMGLVHASIAPEDKALEVAIDVPDVAQPRQIQTARVTVQGANEGDRVWMTLAAVDLGILNLTGFDSPDPQAHYFGQRRLGVELRDVYGRLIDGMNGAMGQVRSGGDADNAARLQSPPPTQDLVASFSGLVEIGPGGVAEVDIPLPAFNGTVRLMAVAWSGRAVGQAERDMFVRDPVVVTASLPRFLAPGDTSRLLLEVVHAGGPSGEMGLTLAADGLTLGAGPGRFALAEGGKAVFDVPVTAGAVGDPVIDLALTTPDGEVLRQSLRLPIRANDPEIARTRRFSLAGGDSFAFSDDVFADLRAGTGRALLSAGPLARFDAPGLLTALDRYPYGCTEQVTSGALPLLYLSSVAEASGLGTKPDLDRRIADAIARVLTRQAPNGAFGLWRPASGDFWLDAYVTDFLSRARAEGHAVPDRAFRMALDNLRNRVNYAPDFDLGGTDIAYALMVLAREGAASMSDLRYYADVKGESFSTPLATAQIGAALAAYGDPTRADRMFERAGRMLSDRTDAPVWRSDYGTNQRDAAAVLALATEAGSTAVDSTRLANLVAGYANRPSTQEAAWTLLAAQTLIRAPEQSGLSVNGQPVSGSFVQMRQYGQAPALLSSADGQATEITLTTIGVPQVAPAAGGTGYRIERAYFAMDGSRLDGTRLKVGDRFVSLLTVTPFEDAQARLIIDDPLPAGVEIDNPNLLRSGDIGALSWIVPSEVRHSEFRADRFVSAVDLRGPGQVRVAYVARAVSAGVFHRPAALVEDMYRPSYRAWTEASRVEIAE